MKEFFRLFDKALKDFYIVLLLKEDEIFLHHQKIRRFFLFLHQMQLFKNLILLMEFCSQNLIYQLFLKVFDPLLQISQIYLNLIKLFRTYLLKFIKPAFIYLNQI